MKRTIAATAAVLGIAAGAAIAAGPQPNEVLAGQVKDHGAIVYVVQMQADSKGKHLDLQIAEEKCSGISVPISSVRIHHGHFSAHGNGVKVTGDFVTSKKVTGTVDGSASCAPKKDYVAKKVTGG